MNRLIPMNPKIHLILKYQKSLMILMSHLILNYLKYLMIPMSRLILMIHLILMYQMNHYFLSYHLIRLILKIRMNHLFQKSLNFLMSH